MPIKRRNDRRNTSLRRWPRAARPAMFCGLAVWSLHAAAQPAFDLRLDTALPMSQAAQLPLIDGQLQLGNLDDGWLYYDARYAFEQGDFLDQIAVAPATRPSLGLPLSRRLHSQRVGVRLPLPWTAPIVVEARDQQIQAWTVHGERPSSDQHASLGWAPRPVRFKLDWKAPRAVSDATQPLDCDLSGSLALNRDWVANWPMVGHGEWRLTGRNCTADLTARDAAPVDMRAWGTQWRYGSADHPSTLAFGWFEPVPLDLGDDRLSGAIGRELSWSQQRNLGLWSGSFSVGLRSVDDGAGADDLHWTARADLGRRIADLQLTATWRRAADPLWFVPGVQVPMDEYGLGLDVSRWFAALVGGWGPQSSLSLRWRDAASDRMRFERHSLNWKFAWAW